MIEPITFGFHLTYTCPLECVHCCFRSGPHNREHLESSKVISVIEQLDTTTIKMIAFTGGEPFLLGKNLVEFVKKAHIRGLITRIVTSGYFGNTPQMAEARLRELVEVGLDEIVISWDDFHEAFVQFETIKNVVKAAKKFDHLKVAISIVESKHAKWTAKRVKHELGPELTAIIFGSSLNLTGRAEEELRESDLLDKTTLGPCHYVLAGPTLNGKDKLLACCGTIPETERLYIGNGTIDPKAINKQLEQARNSILFNWLYIDGPYGILKWISERYGISIPDNTKFGGNCQACKYLFETPEIECLLDKAIEEKAPELRRRIYLLESLGLFNKERFDSKWNILDALPTNGHL